MNLTQEQHDCFDSMGFVDRIDGDSYTSYEHPDVGILVICTSALPLDNFPRFGNNTDVVIAVQGEFSAAQASTALSYSTDITDIISLKHLPQYMMYRAFNYECREYLNAQSYFGRACADYYEVEQDCGYTREDLTSAAETLHVATLGLLRTAKPPAYRPSSIA